MQMSDSEFVDGVLYTSKEQKMHVTGQRKCCDLSILRTTVAGSVTDLEVDGFVKDGFFIAENMVPTSNIAHARAYINDEYPSWMKQSCRQDDWRMHLNTNLQSCDEVPVEHAPILNLLLQSPDLLSKLTAVMGSRPRRIFYNQVAYRTPLSNPTPSVMRYTPGAEYHIDGQANQYGTRFPDPWSILLGIALVDINSMDMGNFTVFPGTHTSVKWHDYPNQKRAKTLPALGEPCRVCLSQGSAVFAHALLPHRGGKNITSADQALQLGIDYDGLENIPKGTREMVFFRIQAEHIDYRAELRSSEVLNFPLNEFSHFAQNNVS